MSHWLITGAGGLLGRELVAFLSAQDGERVTALGRGSLDVRSRAAVEDAVLSIAPDVVVNCAAWTDAEAAEDHEFEALLVNGYGADHLAGACLRSGAVLLHVSTDYVFDGAATEPYDEDSPPRPLNAYGRTKLVGERAVLARLPRRGYVVRTAWLYGKYGRNFVHTMMRLERQQETVDVVDDQVGQPTWTRDLAWRIVELYRTGAPAGVYHGTSGGQTSWYGLACEVFALLGADPCRVRPISSAQRDDRAVRPRYSALGHGRWAAAGIAPPRDWRHTLREAFPTLLEAEVTASS
ncbi:MAG: dTDP-4-dehydrorhamnose reductase [Actinomadura rubrobrunea]|nr:dTDP-4-dehydrorhamnose reductase [Actinomadura rubrobrunea]